MVVNDLDLMGIAFQPSEVDAPLVIDPNTVLPSAASSQLLEPVPPRHAQIIESLSGIDEYKPAQHGALELARISADALPLEETLSVPITEALDHLESCAAGIITSSVTICAR
jgi:hypothetical protein